MKTILLSGGSGKKLWPLSNDTRSKQFLKLLDSPTGRKESMVQRNIRQLHDVGLSDEIIFTASNNQVDTINSQVGNNVQIVTVPSKRDTFSAIALACSYLLYSRKISDEEIIVVMPCDQYTTLAFYNRIKDLVFEFEQNKFDLMLMGIVPNEPLTRYGYIVRDIDNEYKVIEYKEKPTFQQAKELIQKGALWNGGVYVFKLGWIEPFISNYIKSKSYTDIREKFNAFPKISFVYKVIERTKEIGVMPYSGEWKDIGTWHSLTKLINKQIIGNGIITNSRDSSIINELNIPIVCNNVDDVIIAASYDGILVSSKMKSHEIKPIVDQIENRPMYEERRWGEYKVIDTINFYDGYKALTKKLTLKPNCSISYQLHNKRAEVWTFVDGEGIVVLNDEIRRVKRGDIIHIEPQQKHALKALTSLTFIEVQLGSELIEEDIVRFNYNWE